MLLEHLRQLLSCRGERLKLSLIGDEEEEVARVGIAARFSGQGFRFKQLGELGVELGRVKEVLVAFWRFSSSAELLASGKGQPSS